MAWLIHQYRAAYELCGTEYSDFAHTDLDVGLRDTLIALDTEMLGECRAIFTNARNTAARLKKFNGLDGASRSTIRRAWLADCARGRYGDYVLSVGRIESVKRVDLLVRAMAHGRPGTLRLVIAGDGTQRAQRRARRAEARASRTASPSSARCDDEQLVDLYAGALAVVYPPFDEDFGYVTLEAFLARKPVITCTDSGGPNEFVADGVNGWSCEPHAGGAGGRDQRRGADRARAAQHGRRRLRASRARSPGTA